VQKWHAGAIFSRAMKDCCAEAVYYECLRHDCGAQSQDRFLKSLKYCKIFVVTSWQSGDPTAAQHAERAGLTGNYKHEMWQHASIAAARDRGLGSTVTTAIMTMVPVLTLVRVLRRTSSGSTLSCFLSASCQMSQSWATPMVHEWSIYQSIHMFGPFTTCNT
jgi:hypothetical protein